MRSFDCNRRVSEVEPSAWSYSHRTSVECAPVSVKDEPEWSDGDGVSEAAAWAGLYADHDVKEELVFGPEQLQQQDIAISNVVSIPHEDPCQLEPTAEATTAPACSPISSREPCSDRSLQRQFKLGTCFVRLEHLQAPHTTCLPDHIQITTKEKLYTCEICQRQFTHKHSLTNHSQTHKNKQVFSCDVCQKEFAFRCHLSNHIRTHNKGPYSCSICHKQFTYKCNLIIHNRKHVNKQQYSCNICHRQFTSKSDFIIHSQTHKHKPQYTCDICQKQFSQKCNLVTHIQKHVSKEQSFCNVCQKQYSNKWNLLRHSRKHANEKQTGTNYLATPRNQFVDMDLRKVMPESINYVNEKQFSCHICRRQFTLNCHLMNHIRTHNAKPYNCDICQKQFLFKSSFIRHSRKHKNQKHFSCDTCQKQFSYKCNMLRHRRKHVNKKPSFNICQNQSLYNCNLSNHSQTHENNNPPSWQQSGKKAYSCDICQKQFDNHSCLTSHIRRHTLYCCNMCDEHFCLASSFTKHVQTHTKEKCYSCDICDKQFLYRRRLNTHKMQIHKADKPNCDNAFNEKVTQSFGHTKKKRYSCDICDKQFLYRRRLNAHHMLMHKAEKSNCDNTLDKHVTQLSKHMQGHAKGKVYSCNFCQKKFVYRQSLQTHIMRVHKLTKHLEGDAKEKRYPCNSCDEQFLYRRRLNTHKMQMHKEDKPDCDNTFSETSDVTKDFQGDAKDKRYPCNICEQQFLDRRRLNTHKIQMHKADKPNCDIKFNESSDVTKDLQGDAKEKQSLRHTKKKRYPCDICDKQFLYRRRLKAHKILMHKADKPNCDNTVDQQVMQFTELIKHKQNHAIGKIYSCNFCQKKFVYRQSLETHIMRLHKLTKHLQSDAKEKRYPCNICDKQFLYRRRLDTHKMQIHKVDKPNCDNTFNDSSDVTKDLKSDAKEKHDPRGIYEKQFLDIRRLSSPKVHKTDKPSCDDTLNEQVTRLSDISKHTQGHAKEKRYSCDICHKKFLYRRRLKTHKVEMHKADKPDCDNTVNKLSDVTKDLQADAKEKHDPCGIYEKQLLYIRRMSGHKTQMHKTDKPNDDDASNKQITQSSDITNHTQGHATEKRYSCDICHKTFLCRRRLKTHKIQIHKAYKPNGDNTSNKQVTQSSHTKKKRYSCDVCQKQFIYRQSLQTHMRKDHPTRHLQGDAKEKLHSCNICQKQFAYNKSLQTHMRKDHPTSHLQGDAKEKLHSCNICQKQFAYKKSLQTHMLTSHLQGDAKEKLHSCNICQKQFAYRKSLQFHMRKHYPTSLLQGDANEKLSCHVCHKQFVYRQSLDSHMVQHKLAKSLEGDGIEKLFSCQFCQKQFAYRKPLRTHMRKHHPTEVNSIEKIHSCNICQKKFAYRKNLKSHMEQHNPANSLEGDAMP